MRSFRFFRTLAVLAVLSALPPGSALAVDFRIGAGVGLAPDYEGSDDYGIAPNWLVDARDLYHPDTYVTIAGPLLRSNFVPHPQFRFGLSGQYVGDRDNVDDGRVDDMRGVDASLLLGVIGGWDFLPEPDRSLAATVDFRADMLNGNGYLITPRVTYFGQIIGNWSLNAEVYTTWANDDYMSEYYGVSAANAARSGLSTFNADDGFKEVGLALNLNYRISENWTATGLAVYNRLVDDAADSPVVDDRGDENQVYIGALVSFGF